MPQDPIVKRFFHAVLFVASVAVAAPLAVHAAPANVGQRTAGVRSSLQLAPRSQADELLNQLGYGAALAGGSLAVQSRSADGQQATQDLAPHSQALQTLTELRGGPVRGEALDLGGATAPRGAVNAMPRIGYGGVSGQDSPYTSTGNAAGFTPYPDARGLLQRP